MKRRDLGVAALGGLAVATGCAPQNRASFEPPAAENADRTVSPAASGPRIAAITLHEVKIGTIMRFLVYHDRSAVITVSASDPSMTDIKTVNKHQNATHVSIAVIADGESGVQVLSNDLEFLAFIISTNNR